jgi:hypothetical protein
MRRMVIAVAFLATAMPSIAVGQTRKTKSTSEETTRIKRGPKGVTITGNRVTLKKGYRFVVKPNNILHIQSMVNNVVVDGLRCVCSGKGKCEWGEGAPGVNVCWSHCDEGCNILIALRKGRYGYNW